MIILRSQLHSKLIGAITRVLNNQSPSEGYCDEWIQLLRENPHADGFLALMDKDVNNWFFRSGSGYTFSSIDDWIMDIEAWRGHRLDPRSRPDPKSDILYHLWEQFTTEVTQLLQRARLFTQIPQQAGLLAFLGGLSKCVVFEYDFRGAIARLRPISVITNPQSVFDFWGAIDQVASQSAKNALKNILSTGHKIVFHRGILAHVDRRRDTGVFGPSIDTLVLAEILAQYVYEGKNQNGNCKYQTAIEIGCGNGLLTASLVRHLKSLKEIFAIDIDFPSVACTVKNFRLAAETREGIDLLTRFICSPFDASLLNHRFDLIVCNPPYIPIPDTEYVNDSSDLSAIGGTDLAQAVLAGCENLLNPNGLLFLMSSSLSFDGLLRQIPKTCNIEQPIGEDGFEVMFDVEAVLNRPQWIRYLTEKCGLIERAGIYYHTLHPLIIRKSSFN